MPSQRCLSVWMSFSILALSAVSTMSLFKSLFLLRLPQEQEPKPASEPSSTQADPVPDAPAERPAEVADETWEEKEDKQNSEPDRPKAAPEPTGQKYQYKEGRQRPLLLHTRSFFNIHPVKVLHFRLQIHFVSCLHC